MWTLTVSYAIARDYAQCRWLTGPPGERCGNAKVAGVPWTCTDLGICALDANARLQEYPPKPQKRNVTPSLANSGIRSLRTWLTAVQARSQSRTGNGR